ncbi:DUF4432 family protein [Synoicihabitans lomoniglobus]|uniref:DUF4432 family protein n=1 Tax=Synoicihabitans lomoniglobus TaxID=2909285 RepID=UPI002ECFB0DC|nr:DUF4432 family protein [Opitutaceae bacterium LMO-M01]
MLENTAFQVEIWPDKGGAITRYVDRASAVDVIWRNPYGQPPRLRPLDQPMVGGSDLYDVMDGSWYVSLPNGFFAGSYLGAPLGTHGELRSLPWDVTAIEADAEELRVSLTGRSVRTPLLYHRTLTLRRDDPKLYWREAVENRSQLTLPVAWLQHPTFGGPLLAGARLLVPARTVRVGVADDPASLQLQSGYHGEWPWVRERESGVMRDCRVVPPLGSGRDHSVQVTDLREGWGCVWNEGRNLGFALEWDCTRFPYAWSWNSAGGIAHYPLWGEGHIITLQPSTSPVGRFEALVQAGDVLEVPAGETVSTQMVSGFVTRESEPRISQYSST